MATVLVPEAAVWGTGASSRLSAAARSGARGGAIRRAQRAGRWGGPAHASPSFQGRVRGDQAKKVRTLVPFRVRALERETVRRILTL